MTHTQGVIERYTDRLTRIFRQARDKHEAHRESTPVLQDMSGDRGLMTAILGN